MYFICTLLISSSKYICNLSYLLKKFFDKVIKEHCASYTLEMSLLPNESYCIGGLSSQSWCKTEEIETGCEENDFTTVRC